MASFAEMEAAVFEITARPDLVTLTRISLRAAILAAHSLNDFDRDVKDFVLADYVPPASTNTGCEPLYFSNVLPADFRAVQRIELSNQGRTFDRFERLQGLATTLYTGAKVPYTWRLAGTGLIIGWIGGAEQFTLKYYAFPAITPGAEVIDPWTTDSWIAAGMHADYLINVAAARVLNSIGMKSDADALGNNIVEGRADLIAANN